MSPTRSLVTALVLVYMHSLVCHAQSANIAGDVPNVRFTTQDINSCDPLVQVLLDPRTAAFREFIMLLGQQDGKHINKLMRARLRLAGWG